jgi:futalosine hydrolase
MNILVIAATEMELAPFLAKNSKANHLITGVGTPSSIYTLQKVISANHYDLIIQVGIAGAFSEDISLGETVIVESDCFGDIGVLEKNNIHSVFDLSFTNPNEFPFQGGLLINENIDSYFEGFKKAKAVTINLISDNIEFATLLHNKYNALIETMEGAAFHFVCLQEKIPFVQIRGVSNKVGERDKSKWKINEAILTSNNILNEYYQHKKFK